MSITLTIVSATGVLAIVVLLGRWRWTANSRRLRVTLEETHSDVPANPIGLATLPAPVRRYLSRALGDNQDNAPAAVALVQRGRFLVNPKPNGWRPFTATQYIRRQAPAFLWDAAIRIAPGLAIMVRDAYMNQTATMEARLLGLLPLVGLHNRTELNSAALQRYLAEAVWYPHALLPQNGVLWTPVDDRHARATLDDGASRVTLEFTFGEDDTVTEVFSPARFREVAGEFVATPWRGRFSDYRHLSGLWVPGYGEVQWELPQGALCYWQGEIVELRTC